MSGQLTAGFVGWINFFFFNLLSTFPMPDKRNPKHASTTDPAAPPKINFKLFAKIIGYKKPDIDVTAPNVGTVDGTRDLGQIVYKPTGQVLMADVFNEVTASAETGSKGRSFCTIEVATLQSESSALVKNLSLQRLNVSAEHNHFVQTVPPIIFVHATSTDEPLVFAAKLRRAFEATVNPDTCLKHWSRAAQNILPHARSIIRQRVTNKLKEKKSTVLLAGLPHCWIAEWPWPRRFYFLCWKTRPMRPWCWVRAAFDIPGSTPSSLAPPIKRFGWWTAAQAVALCGIRPTAQ